MNKLILIFVTIAIASCSTVDINTPSQTNFIKGSTLSAIVDKHGPPYSVMARNNEVNMTYFVGTFSKHTIRLGSGARIERYVLKFDSNDRLVDETSAFLTGNIGSPFFSNVVSYSNSVKDECEFQNIGSFLLSKGIFFNEPRWFRDQNPGHNYFQYLQSGEIPRFYECSRMPRKVVRD
jgi:hypothetical protein